MESKGTWQSKSHARLMGWLCVRVLILLLPMACLLLVGWSISRAQAGAPPPLAATPAARVAGADTPAFNLNWSSTESDPTSSIAWGDYDGDGDLDLAVGNKCYDSDPYCESARSVQLYRNDGGTLTTSVVWSSAETDPHL